MSHYHQISIQYKSLLYPRDCCKKNGVYLQVNLPKWPYYWIRAVIFTLFELSKLVALSAKLMPTFADRGCCVVTATDPHGHILGFVDRSRYFFFQVAPQLYSRGWIDPVPEPLLLRKSGSAGNRTRDLWICSQELWPLDHRDGSALSIRNIICRYKKLLHHNLHFCWVCLEKTVKSAFLPRDVENS
jgi:hypothetical protein